MQLLTDIEHVKQVVLQESQVFVELFYIVVPEGQAFVHVLLLLGLR